MAEGVISAGEMLAHPVDTVVGIGQGIGNAVSHVAKFCWYAANDFLHIGIDGFVDPERGDERRDSLWYRFHRIGEAIDKKIEETYEDGYKEALWGCSKFASENGVVTAAASGVGSVFKSAAKWVKNAPKGSVPSMATVAGDVACGAEVPLAYHTSEMMFAAEAGTESLSDGMATISSRSRFVRPKMERFADPMHPKPLSRDAIERIRQKHADRLAQINKAKAKKAKFALEEKIKAEEAMVTRKVGGVTEETFKRTNVWISEFEDNLGGHRASIDNNISVYKDMADGTKIKTKELRSKPEHFLKPDSKKGNHATGWHSDPDGFFQETRCYKGRVIEFKDNIINGPDGAYRIEWKFAGAKKFKPSTMFPKNMSHQKVCETIVDAYKWCENEGIVPDLDSRTGRYVMNGETKFGFDVRLVISECGDLITAYPVWD